VEVISCPTCGRTNGPGALLAEEARKRLADLTAPLKVAVMGCVVNGPGEAKQTDAAVALGRSHGQVYAAGRRVAARVPYERLIDLLEAEVRRSAETGARHGD
jgi:(E)-4-hydroxy-3-methylbut-2-enyl-diphosphate synthase